MNASEKGQHTEVPRALREMLVCLQHEAYKRIRDLRRDQHEESESGPADELDVAQTTAEVETHAALIAREEEKLRYLDEALTRLEVGRYGQCLRCGGLIPIERLTAIPFASHCVDCQEKVNRARQGWGEGATIPPYDHQWTLPEEMEEIAETGVSSTDPEEQLTIHSGEILPSEPANQTKHLAKKKPIRRRTRR